MLFLNKQITSVILLSIKKIPITCNAVFKNNNNNNNVDLTAEMRYEKKDIMIIIYLIFCLFYILYIKDVLLFLTEKNYQIG